MEPYLRSPRCKSQAGCQDLLALIQSLMDFCLPSRSEINEHSHQGDEHERHIYAKVP